MYSADGYSEWLDEFQVDAIPAQPGIYRIKLKQEHDNSPRSAWSPILATGDLELLAIKPTANLKHKIRAFYRAARGWPIRYPEGQMLYAISKYLKRAGVNTEGVKVVVSYKLLEDSKEARPGAARTPGLYQSQERGASTIYAV